MPRRSRPPGVMDGRLADCLGRPNCVCSCDMRPRHAISPLPMLGTVKETLDLLADWIERKPSARLITRQGCYLHAEFRSRFFRFVDDVELLVDEPKQVVHCRSEARLGRRDFGVNRRRVEKMRALLLQAAGETP